MKRTTALLLAILFLPLAAFAETLPAPPFLGSYVERRTLEDGLTYSVYLYEYEKESSKSDLIMDVYQIKIGGSASYSIQKMWANPEKAGFEKQTTWYSITDGAYTAYLSFETGYYAKKSTLTLYVPEGMEFVLNPEGTKSQKNTSQNPSYNIGVSSSFQNPSYNINVSSPFQNPSYNIDIDSPAAPQQPQRCLSCKGSGKCANCGGDGKYINPFTGDWLTCTSCKDGICSVCGGEGWR